MKKHMSWWWGRKEPVAKRYKKPEQTSTPPFAKCPFCGRDKVMLKRGRYAPHVGPGGVMCHGSGHVYRGAA